MKIIDNLSPLKNNVNSTAQSAKPLKGELSGARGISELSQGDRFRAGIVNITPSGMTLRLENGAVIEAKALVNPDARIGDSAVFLVTEIFKGKILLEMVKPDDESVGDGAVSRGIIREALLSADIPITKENIELVQKLIENRMPIDPKTLQSAVFFLYYDGGLSFERIKFLLDEAFPAEGKTVSMLNTIIEGAARLGKNIGELFSGLLEIQDGAAKDEIYAMLEKLAADFNINIDEHSEHVSILNEIAENDDAVHTPEIIHEGALEPETAEANRHTLKTASTPDNADNAKNTGVANYGRFDALSKAVRSKFFVDLEKGGLREIGKTYKELDKTCAELLSVVRKSGGFPEIEKTLAAIRENLEFMSKIQNFKEYVQIPFMRDERENECELHVFRNKKSAGASDGSASALLALDYNTLKHVEVFITKTINSVSLQFRAENGRTLNILGANMHRLSDAVRAAGFSLSGVSYKKLGEKFDVAKMPEGHKSAGGEIKRYSVDMRV